MQPCAVLSHPQERAAQAHAMGLAEARVGRQWWSNLRMLNRQNIQDALLAEDEERWQVCTVILCLVWIGLFFIADLH